MKKIICLILMICIVTTTVISLVGCKKTITIWPDDEESTDQCTDAPSNSSDPTNTSSPTTIPTTAPTGTAILYNLPCKVHYDWQMMSFILKTSDNKIIVIDGGYDIDADYLVSKLKSITGESVPTIDAWILTHCHEDHINAFSKVIASKTKLVDLKMLYYAFPSDSYIKKYAKGTYDATYTTFKNALPNLDSSKITIMNKGDKYTVGNAQIDVLLTYSEEITDDVMNESSTIFTITIEGQKILFLGDCGAQQGARLVASGADLTADIVQLGHHGNSSLQNNFYRKINAKAALWCAPQWLFDNNYAGQGFNTGAYTTVSLYKYMVNTLKCKIHYVTLDDGFEIQLPADLTGELLPRD